VQTVHLGIIVDRDSLLQLLVFLLFLLANKLTTLSSLSSSLLFLITMFARVHCIVFNIFS